MRRCFSMARAFEDFPVGSRFLSSSYTISAEAMMKFAREFDPQPFHVDSPAASQTLFGGLIASGWQTAAVSMRLFVDTMNVAGEIIGLAVDELRWPKAVRPGDKLRVEIEIIEGRLSESRPGYGIIRYRSVTRNQDDETVQRFVAAAMMPTRATAGLPVV
jgi:acyl dehydratase